MNSYNNVVNKKTKTAKAKKKMQIVFLNRFWHYLMTAILGSFCQQLICQVRQIGVNQAMYLLHIILNLLNTSNECIPKGSQSTK